MNDNLRFAIGDLITQFWFCPAIAFLIVFILVYYSYLGSKKKNRKEK